MTTIFSILSRNCMISSEALFDIEDKKKIASVQEN